MTHFTKPLIASFALIAMSVSASQAKADTYGHIQGLALDTMLKIDALMGETHHYVHTPNYQRMIRSISNMRQRAVRVHVLSIQHGCLIEMGEELRRLDAQYHRIEGLFDNTEYEAGHGHGHIHGATGHVKEHLKCIEDNVHHIREDIAQLTRAVYRPPYSSAPGGYGYGKGYGHGSGYGRGAGYNSHPRSRIRYYNGGYGRSPGRGGISIGGDKFSLNIGF